MEESTNNSELINPQVNCHDSEHCDVPVTTSMYVELKSRWKAEIPKF